MVGKGHWLEPLVGSVIPLKLCEPSSEIRVLTGALVVPEHFVLALVVPAAALEAEFLMLELLRVEILLRVFETSDVAKIPSALESL